MTSRLHPLTEVPEWGQRFKFVSEEKEIGCNLMLAEKKDTAYWKSLAKDWNRLYQTHVTGWIEVEL